ncbi:MAG: DUF342 domain-containing protein [Planctomycetes bacterium]|nr:DUF342 domain-containing protein [Planctomycetota bacterium]
MRLEVGDAATAAQITKQDIMAVLLKERSIIFTPEDEERMGRVIRFLRRGKLPQGEMVIVKGVPPVHGKDGRVIDLVASKSMRFDDKGNVSHYDHNVLRVVNSGMPVLEIVPPTPHVPGRDVFGREALARAGQWPPVVLGPNVARSEDKRTVYSTAAGRFHYEYGTARVEPDLKIQSDISFRTGNIDFERDVVVNKDVFDGFQVKTPQNVVINGSVEGATIEAGKSVVVQSGISGKRKGHITAGGDITCKFANGARLTAGGNISIAKYCYHSDIRCEGQLLIPGGVLCGGEVCCQRGAVVAILGNKAQNKTVVRVELDERCPAIPPELGAAVRSAEKLLAEQTQALQLYQGRLGSLRGVERETAAQILKRIKELTRLVDERRAEVERLTGVSHENSPATLEVRKTIFPNVEVQFDGTKTRFRSGLAGPLRIELRRGGKSIGIVAVDLGTDRASPLPCEPVDD